MILEEGMGILKDDNRREIYTKVAKNAKQRNNQISSFCYLCVLGVNIFGLAEKRFVEAAVDGDDLAGGFAETLRHEEEVSLGLVGRRDRRLGERAVGVELRELAHERISRLVVLVRNVVLRE